MMAKSAKETENELKQYLVSKLVLILDHSNTRGLIKKSLIQIGVKPENFLSPDTFEEASEMIRTKKPQIVWSEYNLKNHTALDLLALHRRIYPNRLDAAFIILSDNNSPAVASRAAEEDSDTLLIRPLSAEDLIKNFKSIILNKCNPSDYQRLIEDGKAVLESGKFDEAINFFIEARSSDKAPCLACYYQSVCLRKLGHVTEAEKILQEGLQHGPKHYKCTVGMFETLMQLKKYEEAYVFGTRLFTDFTANPKFVPDLIWLSVYLKRYEDILGHLDSFMKIEPFDDTLRNHLSAGLVVCGLYLLRQKNNPPALEAFKKADRVCNSKPTVLREISIGLLMSGLITEAREYLDKLPEDVRNSPDFHLAELSFLRTQEPAYALKKAMEMEKMGIKTVEVYETLITNSVRLKRAASVIDDYVTSAVAQFPDKKEFFESLLKQ